MNLLSYKNILLVVGFFILFTNTVFAANLKDAFKNDSGDVKSNNGFTEVDIVDSGPLFKSAKEAKYETGIVGINSIIGTIINTVLSILGVIFLSLMIYGGYLWMTASGSEEKVTKGRNLIIAAIIGLIIVISAYAISYFVISKAGEGVLKT